MQPAKQPQLRPDNTLRWCIVMDYPNHYRDAFFAELSKRVQVHLLLTSREGADRCGLSNTLEEHTEVTHLGEWGYEAVVKSLRLSAVVFARALLEAYRSRPDVLIVHGYRNPACWVAPFMRLLGFPCVMWGESNYFDKQRHWWLELLKTAFLLCCDQAHTYGRSGREYFMSLGLRADRVMVTQPTVLEQKFQTVQKVPRADPNRIHLLYVGRFTAVKNLHYLLEAMAELRVKHADECPILTMVGFGSEEQALRRYCSQEGLEGNVLWLGRLQQEEIAHVMAEQDALVLPSVSETYGLVVLEAMFAGLPVIVSTQCGCVEDLVNKDTGWRIDPASSDSLVAALKELITLGPDGARTLGCNARQRAEIFSSMRSVDLTIAAVRRLLHRIDVNGTLGTLEGRFDV